MIVLEGFLDGIRPPERLSPSEWADKYRFLSSKASAEPGRWRTSRVPYLREIMDRMSVYDPCREIYIMKGAQLGLTEMGFNALGYYIDLAPCPIMYLMPTDATIKRNSKLRIAPMIESTPRLSKKIKQAKKKDSGNSMYQKDFPGGTLLLSGANSAAGLRSVPVKVLILDEVDAYPTDLDGEGDAVGLAKARTRTFAKKKIAYISTPLIHGSSIIEEKYLESSQKKFFVPCPHCQTMQDLVFANLKYQVDSKKKVHDVHYECCSCEMPIEEHQKEQMLDGGEWRDTVDGVDSTDNVGYHINSLYSPLGWYSWHDAAQEWIDAQKNSDKLKVFINTVLGETWMEKGEVPDWENLYNRRSEYQPNSPSNKVHVITVGVDIQKDRIELEVVGWHSNKVSESLDYRILNGDTSGKEVWNELAKIVSETWTRTDGLVLPMYMMAIDTGYNTAEAYEFCRRFHISRVVPIKGQDSQAVIVSQPRAVDQKKGKKKRKHSLNGLSLYNIGVSILKKELYGWLRQKIDEGEVPPGYCYFPKYYDQHYFKMLTAEQLTKKIVKGYTKYQWEKIRERNEALDCRVYARAAAAIAGIDYWKPANWDAVVGSYQKKSTSTRNNQKRKSNFW